MLILGMGVGCSIREIAFTTGTGKISAFWVFSFPSGFALLLHLTIITIFLVKPVYQRAQPMKNG